MERSFQRKLEALEDIFGFIREFGMKYHLSDGSLFFMDFTVEELFTNMVKYNSGGKSDIAVKLDHDDSDLVITMIDFDSDAFDIAKIPPIDTSQALEERKVGGLGIHLIKRLADSVDFLYANRQNKIIIRKKIEGTNVNG